MAPRKSVLPVGWEPPETIRGRLGHAVGRQRLMAAEGHLLLVLHAPPEEGEAERAPRLFWRKPDATWQSNAHGQGPQALARHLQEFADLLERLDRAAEDAHAAETLLRIVGRLGPLSRTLRNLHRTLQEARDAQPDDLDLLNARDRAYALEREAELLQHEVQNQLQLRLARQADAQAAASHRLAVHAHRLNVLVAFFLPLGLLASLFGVNLHHGLAAWIPEPTLFAGLILLGLLLGGGLAAYVAQADTEALPRD